MVTERLYYTDPYLTSFEAAVVADRDLDGRRGVILDRTAFYPSSGGQPFDTGTLGASRVVDVIETEDGDVLHLIDGDRPHGRVTGRIDWARRFEHMQQHTGQHILSAAFDRLLQVRTVSFHLGSAAASIDLAREVTPAEILSAEDEANHVVWEDRPVTIRFVDAGEAAALPLRKESTRTGRLRIIEVEGFDVSACGGTHVARTGSIGIIVVSSWERFKGGSRVEFRCGGRALGAHRTLRDSVAAAVKLISVAPDELSQGVERLQAERRDLQRRAKDLEARVAAFEADALAGGAVDLGGVRTVITALDLDINGLKTVAQRIVNRPGHAAVLVSSATPVSVVVARSADVPIDAGSVLRRLTSRFGGKGGGRPELAQGGGLQAAPGDVADAARREVSADRS